MSAIGVNLGPTSLAISIVLVALVVFWAVVLIQALSHKTLTTLERVVWVLVILMFPLVGAIAWFIGGRNRSIAMWVTRSLSGPNDGNS